MFLLITRDHFVKLFTTHPSTPPPLNRRLHMKFEKKKKKKKKKTHKKKKKNKKKKNKNKKKNKKTRPVTRLDSLPELALVYPILKTLVQNFNIKLLCP